MKKKPSSTSAFFHLRVLIGLTMFLSGLFLALLGLGTFSAQAQQQAPVIEEAPDSPLVPPMFDCARVKELGYDVQENFRAGAVMILSHSASSNPSFLRT